MGAYCHKQSTSLFLLPSAITPTLGLEFINGHHADNHID
jgi:hypothetical protein